MITAFYLSVCKLYLFLSYKGGWIGGQCKATKTRSTLEGKIIKRWRVVMKGALITRIWVADVALQWWRAYILLNALKKGWLATPTKPQKAHSLSCQLPQHGSRHVVFCPSTWWFLQARGNQSYLHKGHFVSTLRLGRPIIFWGFNKTGVQGPFPRKFKKVWDSKTCFCSLINWF